MALWQGGKGRWGGCFWLVALLAASCAQPTVTTSPGGGAPGSGSGARPSAPPPAFSLPDAGPAPVTADAAGAARSCAEEAHQAEIVPLDLLLLLDASGSMNEPAGPSTKWDIARTALSAFVRDPRSAGLGVGLQFFPSNLEKPCTSNQDCFPGLPGTQLCQMGSVGRCSLDGTSCTMSGQPCPGGSGTCMPPGRTCLILLPALECDQAIHSRPALAIAELPAAETRLLDTLSGNAPGGNTPMGPAVRGALANLRARLLANPGRRVALILAGDGLPEGSCPMNDIPAIATDLAAAYQGSPSIPTYVIGVFGPAELAMMQPLMDQLARAGGSARAFVLEANGDLTRRLQDALEQIRGAALACEYGIPPASGGPIDFGKVNVRYTGPGGAENVPYVERAERCDPMRGGWYYDVAPAMGVPTRILTCPATCRRFNAEKMGKVELVFGCGAQVIL